jgi:hypothetical protein
VGTKTCALQLLKGRNGLYRHKVISTAGNK